MALAAETLVKPPSQSTNPNKPKNRKWLRLSKSTPLPSRISDEARNQSPSLKARHRLRVRAASLRRRKRVKHSPAKPNPNKIQNAVKDATRRVRKVRPHQKTDLR